MSLYLVLHLDEPNSRAIVKVNIINTINTKWHYGTLTKCNGRNRFGRDISKFASVVCVCVCARACSSVTSLCMVSEM